jgi:protein-disulfide isomerase
VYCKKLLPLLEQVLDTYPESVRIVFKNFPLKIHKFATKAAIAAMAADSQGRFWEFHDLLFDNFGKLNDQKIKEIATELGLNQEKFETEKKNLKILAKVRQDFQDGRKAGVRGTPTIFVNGKKLKNRTLEGFKVLIDKELKKK